MKEVSILDIAMALDLDPYLCCALVRFYTFCCLVNNVKRT